MLLSHLWNKYFCAGVTKVSCSCYSSLRLTRQGSAGLAYLAVACVRVNAQDPQIGLAGGWRRYCLSLPGLLGEGRETRGVNGERCARALPSRLLWVGRQRLRALHAPGIGWRFSRRQPARRAMVAILTPGTAPASPLRWWPTNPATCLLPG